MQVLITRHDSSYEQRDFTRQLLKTPIVDQRIEDDWTQFMMGDCQVVLPYTDDNWAFFYPNESPPDKLSLDFRVSGKTVFKGVNYIGAARNLRSDEITVQFLEVLKELAGGTFTIPGWSVTSGGYLKLQDALLTAAAVNNFQLDFATNYRIRALNGQSYGFDELYIHENYFEREGLTMLKFIKDVAIAVNMVFWLDYGDPVDTPLGEIVALDKIKMRDRGTLLGTRRDLGAEFLEGETEGREHPKGVTITYGDPPDEHSLGETEDALEITFPFAGNQITVLPPPSEYLNIPGSMVVATADSYYRWMIGNKNQYLKAKVLGTDILPMNWVHIPVLGQGFSFLVNAVKQDFVDGISEIEGEALAA